MGGMFESKEAGRAVQVALGVQGRTLTDVAGSLRTGIPVLSRLVNHTSPLDTRSHWPALLAELGIEVVFRVRAQDAE